MILALVGTRNVRDPDRARGLIRHTIRVLRPTEVVTGDATGIDALAAEIASELGIPCVRLAPVRRTWNEGFKPRNTMIAQICDHLVRLHDETKTYGSGWTADYAHQIGKKVQQIDLRTASV